VLAKTGHRRGARETHPQAKVLQNQGDRAYYVKIASWRSTRGIRHRTRAVRQQVKCELRAPSGQYRAGNGAKLWGPAGGPIPAPRRDRYPAGLPVSSGRPWGRNAAGSTRCEPSSDAGPDDGFAGNRHPHRRPAGRGQGSRSSDVYGLYELVPAHDHIESMAGRQRDDTNGFMAPVVSLRDPYPEPDFEPRSVPQGVLCAGIFPASDTIGDSCVSVSDRRQRSDLVRHIGKSQRSGIFVAAVDSIRGFCDQERIAVELEGNCVRAGNPIRVAQDAQDRVESGFDHPGGLLRYFVSWRKDDNEAQASWTSRLDDSDHRGNCTTPNHTAICDDLQRDFRRRHHVGGSDERRGVGYRAENALSGERPPDAGTPAVWGWAGHLQRCIGGRAEDSRAATILARGA